MKKNLAAARVVAAAAVVGLSSGLAMPVVMTQPAVAQEAASPVVNSEATGSLTIHKRANPDSTAAPTGNEQQVGGTPLAGVGFTIYRINDVDLTTNDGLAAAANLSIGDYVNGTEVTGDVTPVATETTDEAGQIILSDLELGAYIIVETGPLPGYAPASPFLAFVPMTQGNAETGGTSWNYDVHAYPKNYESTATKEVEDSNANAGDTIEFTITSDVPPVADNATSISRYTVQDDLQENLITTTPEQVSVDGFENGTHYTVAVDPATQQVTVEFTPAGLQLLTERRTADASYQVVTTIEAAVLAPTDTGKLTNQATVITNNGSGGGDTTTETNETVTYWGNVQITKVDAGDENTFLEGAVFELYTPGDNGRCEDGDQTEGQRVTANGENQWTTNAEGLVTIEGLHVNDFEDNGVTESADQAPVYCLFEIQSPAGYELLADPIELTLTQTAVDQAPGVYTLAAEVRNLRDTTPNLPMTGGMGIGLLAGIGAVLLAAAAWFARRSSRS